MIKKTLFIALSVLVFACVGSAQTLDNLKEINKTWEKFYLAFDSLDYRPMAEIHSKDVIRIAGGQWISDYNTYINNYKNRFEKAKDERISNTISLRFFERINNDSIASERGVYKLIRKNKNNEKQTYYGQFHVIFKKENGQWQIVMDYDSNEEDSIGEEDFVKAHGINQFDKFLEE